MPWDSRWEDDPMSLVDAEMSRLKSEIRVLKRENEQLQGRRTRDALAQVVGAFTNGIYCASCGDTVDDCVCVIGVARRALAE